MSTASPAAVAIEQVPGRQECRAVCTCGWETLSLTAAVAAQSAELHSLRCTRFRLWAHESIENLSDALGYYVPVQITELLHVLVDEPPAAAHIMPWLYGLEDREHA